MNRQLTATVKSMLETRIGKKLICHKCNKEIFISEFYYQARQSRGVVKRYYHQECWDRMFH